MFGVISAALGFVVSLVARRRGGPFLPALAISLLCACSAPARPADTFEEPEDTESTSSALTTLTSLSISPSSATLPAGVTQVFKAAGLYSDGKTRTLASGLVWSSSDATIASVDQTGLATTLKAGAATITALHSATGLSAVASITVSTETLVSVAVTPVSKAAGNNASVQYTATAKFSGGTTVALKGAVVTWASSNPARAAVDATGKVTTAAAGTGAATITAMHVPTNTSSPPAELFVSDSPLQSISLAPVTATIAKGTTQAFVATGLLANGMTSDLTAAATWSSTKPAAATVPAGPGSNGVVTAVGAGTTTIQAKFATFTGSATVTVPAAALTQLAITPPGPRVSLGTSAQLLATGTYDDGTTLDRTESVTWTSSATAVLKVSAAAGSRGKLTPVKVGTATITAKDAKTGVAATTIVTVTNVTLVSLTLNPTAASAPLGSAIAFHASGTYSDASTKDLTTTVTWSATAGASISNADPSRGLATATAVGATVISAQIGAISASTTMNVTPAALASIAISPNPDALLTQQTTQLTATGTYTDGSAVDITSAVGWSTSDATVVDVSNAPGSQGLATALGVGTVTLGAKDPVSGLQGTSTMTVSAPVLAFISLIPPHNSITIGAGLPVGYSAKPQAIGVYSDGHGHTINEACTWSSSDPTIMTVSNVAGQRGTFTGISPGDVTLTATEPISGVTVSATYTTYPPVVVAYTVVPSVAQLAVDATLTFTTNATYSDGSTGFVLTDNWGVSDPTLASLVVSDDLTTVSVTALNIGTVEIGPNYNPSYARLQRATLTIVPGISASLPVAPSATNFQWQGLQSSFIGTNNQPCTGRVTVATSDHATCFTAADDTLQCAGATYLTTYGTSFVATGQTGVDQITLSPTGMGSTGNGACIHKVTGEVSCFGWWNTEGELGNGSTVAAPDWTSWGTGIAHIATGNWLQMCGLDNSGIAYCSGHSFDTVPIAVGGPYRSFVVDDFGGAHGDESGIFRVSDGRSDCLIGAGGMDFGGTSYGQAGAVVMGGYTSGLNVCWLESSGNAFCQSVGSVVSNPIFTGGGPILALAIDPETTDVCAVTSDGALYCKGANRGGELGTGDTNPIGETQVRPPGSVRTACH